MVAARMAAVVRGKVAMDGDDRSLRRARFGGIAPWEGPDIMAKPAKSPVSEASEASPAPAEVIKEDFEAVLSS